jgi:hypothetical protein
MRWYPPRSSISQCFNAIIAGTSLPNPSIIEAHDGRLWAENNEGSGAIFRFTLQTVQDAGANRKNQNPGGGMKSKRRGKTAPARSPLQASRLCRLHRCGSIVLKRLFIFDTCPSAVTRVALNYNRLV